MLSYIATPLEKKRFLGREIYIKRDDLLHPYFSGNKARKFFSLLAQNLQGKILVSYGGNQSNALMSLSALCEIKDCTLIYFTPPFSEALIQEMKGNFAFAQNTKRVRFVQTSFPQEEALSYHDQNLESVFIPQGGSVELAMKGMRILSDELKVQTCHLNHPVFFYSSGIGTASLALAQYDLDVYTALGAGKMEQLQRYFSPYSKRPNILETVFYTPFGKPHQEIWNIYQEWLKVGVEFDLLYDCPLWINILGNVKKFEERDFVFIHSGGTFGNITQQKRYKSSLKRGR